MTDPLENPQKSKWYYEPWAVLLILFTVAGPFGLPLLYKSPKFSRSAKIFFTVLILALTVYIAYELIRMVKAVMEYTAQMGTY